MKNGTWSTNFAENRDKYFPDTESANKRSCYRLDNCAHTWRRQPVAIHVGAGPSLDRSLADLVKLQTSWRTCPPGRRQAVIFATDGALKPLLAAGVKPEFVTILDEHEVTERFFEGVRSGNMTLLATATAFPEAIGHFMEANPRTPNEILFWANANLNTLRQRAMFDFDPEFIPWFPWVRGLTNSVTMMSVALAQRMGIRSHFLVGCDYGVERLPDGQVKTHCDGFAVDQTAFGCGGLPDGEFPGPYPREDYVARVIQAMGTHAKRIDETRMIDRYPIYNCTDGQGALKRMTYMPLMEAAHKFKFMREDHNGSRPVIHGGRIEGDPGEVPEAREGLRPEQQDDPCAPQEIHGHHVQVGG